MNTPPPVLVVLELSALLGTSAREWQEYARVGGCYVPQVVYDEMEFLSGRAPEPEQEKTAREFLRFFPNSGWQLTNAQATHPALTPPSDKTPSKQVRLLLAVGETAHGLAQEQPGALVVLVSNTQPLLQRLQAIRAANLCGITATALLQWARTGQRPPAVTQQMQAVIQSGAASGRSQAPSSASTPPRAAAARTASANSTAPAAPVTGGPASAARQRQSVADRTRPGVFGNLISSLLALLFLALVGLIGWRIVQPASFNQFWQQMGLPPFPGQPPAPPPTPVRR